MAQLSTAMTATVPATTNGCEAVHGGPPIRVPPRRNFDGNLTPIGDDLLATVMRAARDTGATPY